MLRIIGVVTTLLSFVSGSVIVTALVIDKLKQDTITIWEILGQFFYNVLIIYFTTLSMIGIFIGSIFWYFGLKEYSSTAYKERIAQKAFLTLSLLWFGFLLYSKYF